MFDPTALTAAFRGALRSRGQMSSVQYFRITSEIIRRAPCNVLIVGAGRDTELYDSANHGGRTVVLEDNPHWRRHLPQSRYEVVPVEYASRLADGLQESCPPPGGVPEELLQMDWQVILVDGPNGNKPASPGRQQSIYLASLLANKDTTVFVHDYQRKLERLASDRYLGPPLEVLRPSPRLAVFRGPLTT